MDTGDQGKRRFKGLAVAAALLLLLAASLSYRLHQQSETDLFAQFAARQTALASQAATAVEQLLRQLLDGFEQFDRGGINLAADRRLAEGRLALLFHSFPPGLLLELRLHNRDGEVLAAYPAAPLFAPLPDNRPSPAGAPFPLVLRRGHQPLLRITHPVSGGEGAPAELLALISLEQLVQLSLPPQSEALFTFLLDAEGYFLLHRQPELAGRSYTEAIVPARQPELAELLAAMQRGEQGGGVYYEDDEADGAGRKRLLTYAPLNVFGERWTLALTPTDGILTPLTREHRAFHLTLGVALLAMLLAVALPYRLAGHNRRLRRKLLRLAEEASGWRRAAALAERRCRHLLDNAGDAIFFIDPKTGALLEVNRRAEELLGFTVEEIRALSLAVLFPGRQQRRYLRLVGRVLDQGYGEDDRLLFRRKDGTLFTGAVHARLGELGEEQVVHGVLRDVTDIVRIERELRQKNQDLTLLNELAQQLSRRRNLQQLLQEILPRIVEAFAAAGGGIYLAGEENSTLPLVAHQGIDEPVLADLCQITIGIGLAGRVAATGQPRTSADLQKDRRLRSQAVREAGWRAFQAVPLTAGERTVGVLFLFRQDKHIPRREEVNLLLAIGRLLGTDVEGARLFDALQWQNRLTRASNRELQRSRRQLEESLARMEEANRALEQLDRMKSNFLALASHELRTPLTYVLSGTELLSVTLAERLDPQERQALNAVRQGGERLENIVQDLLEAARIESRSLYLARETVDLAAIVTELGEEFRPVLEKRRLSCQMTGLASPIELTGDGHHLKRTFRRLLENAIKFTPEEGCIQIRAALTTPAELQPHEKAMRAFSPSFLQNLGAERLLQVTVQDNGVGIDPEEQLRVFDKFYEVGDISGHFTSRTLFGGKGVGLGLTLVKGMVEAHGGMVWVESRGTGGKTMGSSFHVLLPLTPRAMEASDAAG